MYRFLNQNETMLIQYTDALLPLILPKNNASAPVLEHFLRHQYKGYIDGLKQTRRNSSASAMALRFFSMDIFMCSGAPFISK